MKKLLSILIGSSFVIAVPLFLVWLHHLFVMGLNPILGYVFIFLILLIAVPGAIKIFNWMKIHWLENTRFTPVTLFAIGFVSWFIAGNLSVIFLRNSTLDIHLHDTYFVIASGHIMIIISAFFGILSGIYYWFPKVIGRYLNNTLGYIHFWVSFTGVFFIFWPAGYDRSPAGMPRRYLDYSQWVSFNQLEGQNRFISMAVIAVFAAQLIFVFNFFYSMVKGRKVKD